MKNANVDDIRKKLWVEHCSPLVPRGTLYNSPIDMYNFPEMARRKIEEVDADGKYLCGTLYFIVSGLWMNSFRNVDYKEWFRVAFCFDSFMEIDEVNKNKIHTMGIDKYVHANTDIMRLIIDRKQYLYYISHIKQTLYH